MMIHRRPCLTEIANLTERFHFMRWIAQQMHVVQNFCIWHFIINYFLRTSNLARSYPTTNSRSPWAIAKQSGTGWSTVIPVAIVGQYDGLARKVGFMQAGVTSFDNQIRWRALLPTHSACIWSSSSQWRYSTANPEVSCKADEWGAGIILSSFAACWSVISDPNPASRIELWVWRGESLPSERKVAGTRLFFWPGSCFSLFTLISILWWKE